MLTADLFFSSCNEGKLHGRVCARCEVQICSEHHDKCTASVVGAQTIQTSVNDGGSKRVNSPPAPWPNSVMVRVQEPYSTSVCGRQRHHIVANARYRTSGIAQHRFDEIGRCMFFAREGLRSDEIREEVDHTTRVPFNVPQS